MGMTRQNSSSLGLIRQPSGSLPPLTRQGSTGINITRQNSTGSTTTITRQGSRRLRHMRQLKANKNTILVSLLLLMAVLLTASQIDKVLPQRKPLPSQMRARAQAKMASNKKPQTDFLPGQEWADTDGDLIQAHGGGVIYHEGVYYWYGENKAGATYTAYSLGYSPPRVDVIGVSVYSSKDLVHWSYQGLALKGGSHPDIEPSMVLERPKVLYNARSNSFVMWMHIDTADYELASLGVAVSDSPLGPFTYQGSFRPHGQQSRDFTVFADNSGAGYVAYSSENNRVMHISPLTQDFTHVQPVYNPVFSQLGREAPAMFKFKNVFLLATSGCTGWEPNELEVFWALDPMGDWESLGNPCTGGSDLENEYTFFSQPNYVLPLPYQPDSFVFMADQWDPEDLGASRYVWLPMWVQDNRAFKVSEEELASVWDKLKGPLNRGAKRTTPPVNIEIQWHDGWSISNITSHRFKALEDWNPGDGPDEDPEDEIEDGDAEDESPEDMHEAETEDVQDTSPQNADQGKTGDVRDEGPQEAESFGSKVIDSLTVVEGNRSQSPSPEWTNAVSQSEASYNSSNDQAGS